jgi:hypothetical protein
MNPGVLSFRSNNYNVEVGSVIANVIPISPTLSQIFKVLKDTELITEPENLMRNGKDRGVTYATF